MQVNMNGSEANLAFPGMLNEQLAAFAGTLEDADTPPTTQQHTLYTSLHEKLEAQLGAVGKAEIRSSLPTLHRVDSPSSGAAASLRSAGNLARVSASIETRQIVLRYLCPPPRTSDCHSLSKESAAVCCAG